MKKGFFALLIAVSLSSSQAFALDSNEDKELLALSLKKGIDPYVLSDLIDSYLDTLPVPDSECGSKAYYEICDGCCEHYHNTVWDHRNYVKCLEQCAGKPRIPKKDKAMSLLR